jgi:hypothetical protein
MHLQKPNLIYMIFISFHQDFFYFHELSMVILLTQITSN